MAKPELVPGPAGPKDLVIPTTLSLDKANVDWLDDIAGKTGRSRSDVAREIFRNVRQAETRK